MSATQALYPWCSPHKQSTTVNGIAKSISINTALLTLILIQQSLEKKCSAYGGPKYNKLLNNALFFQRKTTIFPSKINENKPLMLLVVSGIRTVATILHQPRTVLRRNLINLWWILLYQLKHLFDCHHRLIKQFG